MRAKPLNAWAIKSFRGHIIRHTVQVRRADSIGNLLIHFHSTWRQLYRKGWRCVRVKIEEEVKLVRINAEEKARFQDLARWMGSDDHA